MQTRPCIYLSSFAARLRYVIALLLLSGAILRPALAQEWTRFRGPNGSGESEATTVPATWSDGDYNWHVALPGRGHSSPVLWKNQIFLTTAEDEGRRRLLLCLDTADGGIKWQREYASQTQSIHTQNSFASSTPAVDGDHVYVAWATPESYRVFAFKHTGELVWEKNIGSFESQHGFGTSPIVFEDLVVLNNDQDGDSSLVALDHKTGTERLRVPRRTAVVAYSTPCVYLPTGGPPELIFNSQAHGITSINPKDGKTNWEIDVFDKRSVSSPLVVGGLVFGSCGSGAGGNYVVAVRPGREPEVVYKVDSMAPYVPTSVANGDLLFLWSDNGIATCIKAASGDVVWQERVGGNFWGSPIRVAGRLYCVSGDGEVVVLAAGPKFAELGRHALNETCRSTPAVADGRLYLRTESHLYSLGGKK